MRTGDYTSQGCSEGKAMTQSKRAAWIEQPVWMEVGTVGKGWEALHGGGRLVGREVLIL